MIREASMPWRWSVHLWYGRKPEYAHHCIVGRSQRAWPFSAIRTSASYRQCLPCRGSEGLLHHPSARSTTVWMAMLRSCQWTRGGEGRRSRCQCDKKPDAYAGCRDVWETRRRKAVVVPRGSCRGVCAVRPITASSTKPSSLNHPKPTSQAPMLGIRLLAQKFSLFARPAISDLSDLQRSDGSHPYRPGKEATTISSSTRRARWLRTCSTRPRSASSSSGSATPQKSRFRAFLPPDARRDQRGQNECLNAPPNTRNHSGASPRL